MFWAQFALVEFLLVEVFVASVAPVALTLLPIIFAAPVAVFTFNNFVADLANHVKILRVVGPEDGWMTVFAL